MANETQQKFSKPKWVFAKPVKVSKVVLERTMDKQKVNRVRLETDVGNITYKPRIREMESEELAGYEMENVTKELHEVSEFIANNPMLSQLAKDCKQQPQEIYISFAETQQENDNGEVTTYYYTRKSGFEGIYYPNYHKNDELLQKQKEIAERYNSDIDLNEAE